MRAAIVLPGVLALSLAVFDEPGMASLAFFGAVAMLVFVDFGGPPARRLLAYAALAGGGAVLVVLGTLCSTSPALAAGGTAVVGFGLLFAAILGGATAQASHAAILAFVLPAMIPLATDSLSDRLAGWLLGSGAALVAVSLPWPARPPDRLMTRLVAAIRALADAVSAEDPAARDQRAQAATVATDDLRRAYFGTAARPTGADRRGAALGQLVEDVVWLDGLPPPTRPVAPLRTAAEELRERAAGVLRASAALLAGSGDSPDADPAAPLRAADRLLRRRWDAWRARAQVPPPAELQELFDLRALWLAAQQVGDDALRVCGHGDPDDPAGGAPHRRRRRDLAAAHATMRSVWLRNGVRGAVGLAVAVLIGQLADVQHAFWIALGTLAVLRTQALATGVTFVQSVAGNAVGIAVGGLLVSLVGTDTTVLWALLPPAALVAAYARKEAFAAGQAGFAMQLLIVFNLIEPSGWQIGLVRVEDVAVGAGISVLAAVLLWPRGASGVLRDALADAYEGGSQLLVATARRAVDRSEAPALAEPAQAATASRMRLNATVRQVLSERARHITFDELSVLVDGVARLQRVATELRSTDRLLEPRAPTARPSPRLRADRDALLEDLDDLGAWYGRLAESIRGARRPPAPRAAAAPPLALDAAAGADDLAERLAVAWTREHLARIRAGDARLTAAAGRLAHEPR